MKGALRERLRALAREVPGPFPARAFERALERAEVRAAESGVVELRSAHNLLARLERHGTLVVFDPEPAAGARPGAPRRLCSLSARGELLEQLLWDPDEGTPLRWARLRLASGQWLQLRVGTGEHPLWEHSDEILLGDEPHEGPWLPLTQMESLRYEALSHIPAAGEPARLVGGAGGVLLNFLAELARDQDLACLRYRGPYPTDHLFDALGQSFHLAGALAGNAAAARERFTRWALEAAFSAQPCEPPVAFAPAPFELLPLSPAGALLLRERPETCWFEGRSYHCATSCPNRRAGAHRLWSKSQTTWQVGLWLLGEPFESHALIEIEGARINPTPPAASSSPAPGPADPLWKGALELAALSQAAPPLRPALGHLLGHCRVERAHLPRDLARYEGGLLLLRDSLGPALAGRIGGLGRKERLGLSLQFFSELARELVPALLGAAGVFRAEAGGAERARLLSGEAQRRQAARIDELTPLLPQLCARLAEGKGFSAP